MSGPYKDQNFSQFPAVQLEADYHTAVRCTGDADTVVASTVLDNVCIGGNVELIASHTGLLTMLKYFRNSLMGEATIKPAVTKNQKAAERDMITLQNVSAMLENIWRCFILLVTAIQRQY